MRCCSQYAAFALAVIVASNSLTRISADELCSIPPTSYLSAKYRYPQLATAIQELNKHSIATWYTDRDVNYASTAYKLVESCKNRETRLNAVIYGLPGKDCASAKSPPVASSSSVVKTGADYATFLSDFTRIVGNRKIAYVLEPGAVSALASPEGDDANCGEKAKFFENLQTAIKLLSANPNADIYLDVGHWSLQSTEGTSRVVDIVANLAVAGRVKGIALNSLNYRPTAELAQLCTKFQQATGSGDPDAYHCTIDTSRNFVSPASTSSEWCNLRTAGIGQPPTSSTDFANLDYFLWLKPPGESDGECNDGTHSEQDSLPGAPAAGQFFDKSFTSLWNQGFFVNQLKYGKQSNANPDDLATAPALAPNCATPEWSACGDSSGTQCCPSGFYCQPWNSGFYQCMQAPPRCSQQLTDTDLVGVDADLQVVTDTTPADCCAKCIETSGCTGYTFVNEGGASCYLKSKVGEKLRKTGAVSGIVDSQA